MKLTLILIALVMLSGCADEVEPTWCEPEKILIAHGPRIYDGTGENVDHFGNRWHYGPEFEVCIIDDPHATERLANEQN